MDPGYFDIDRQQDPRIKSNILQKLFFCYTRPVFAKGRKGQLSISDVYRCNSYYKAAPRGDSLAAKWKEELDKKGKNKKPSLLRAIIKVHGAKFAVYNLIFALIDASMRLTIPMCLEGLINYFAPSHTGMNIYQAYLYGVGIVGLMAMNALLIHPMLLWLLDMSLKIRVATCSLIYRKLLRLDLTAGGAASQGLTGHVINLLTTDAQRFDMACLFLVDLVRGPIESVMIVYLMYRKIGVACLLGVLFLMMFIPLQGYLSKITSKLRRKTAMRTDNRIRLMNEVIQSIEAIKMYAWENVFARIIGEARKKEMNVIKKMSWLRAVMISCVKLNTKIAIFISIISFLAFENELTAATVFVIFSYYDMLKYTLVDFLPLAITFTLEAYVSVKRMQEFLLLPEVDNQDGVDLLTIDEKVNAPVNGLFEKIGNGVQTYIKSDTNLVNAKPPVLVTLKDYTAYWKGTEEEDKIRKVVALNDINFTIKPGTLTTVIGVVGSGKSTLFQAILRELTPSNGSVVINGKVAYAAQDPWLFDAQVRQNILFGNDLDLRRYMQVIKCCQLKSDLDILPHGDKTVVGERGASLSGGQRARISLARCIYQHADVYLLDDPLAAVDAKVAQAIYEDCIRNYLRDKATVLVTHHAQYARHADNVVVMKGGQIVAQGKYNELQSKVPEFETLIEQAEKVDEKKLKTTNYDNQETIELSTKLRSQRSMSEASQLSFSMDLDNNLAPEYEGEIQNKGSVDSGVYLAYIKSGGGKFSMVLLLVLFLLAQIFYSATDYWLKEWVNIEESSSASALANRNTTTGLPSTVTPFQDLSKNYFHLTREQCVYIYASLIGICMIFTWNKLVVFYNTCIRSSTKLHDTMFRLRRLYCELRCYVTFEIMLAASLFDPSHNKLASRLCDRIRGVTHAPMWFFNHNPSGRILNRFSKDMGQVDTLLPLALVDCLGFFLEVVSILAVVCLVNWVLIFPTAVVASLLYMLRNLYLYTSRELKRIEAIARSQSLNHASATVNGLTTIRSTGAKQRVLAQEFDKLQDLHSSSWSLVLTTNRAFGCWMDMVCCLYLAAVTCSFFLFASDDTFGGNVGLALTQVLGLVGMCQFGMRQTAEVENQMTSVERILEYANLPAENPMDPDEKALKTNHPELDFNKWPTKGEITFQDVSLEYEKPPKQEIITEKEMDTKTETPTYAIRNVSFSLKSGEKTAVVGRTGAGKSSLIHALFKLNKTTGWITVDGVTSSEAGLSNWRARLVALPQRPALFAATLRDNLDPARIHSDTDIFKALDQVELRDMVANLPAGLNTKIGDGGGNLSSGQRQLLCLARAALSNCTVLVLDEATANVDTETDKHIQLTIRQKFESSTVLTIAHRLNTVMDYDKVIVMDKGRVVESGHPYELLMQGKIENQQRRSFLSNKGQAPLAIPEDMTAAERNDEHNETVILSKDRIRTYSSRSESNDQESGGIFKTLVEQSGKETAALLYEMAGESYRKMLEKKKNT